MRFMLGVFCAVCLLAGMAGAEIISIPNYSFESPSDTGGDNDVPDDWTWVHAGRSGRGLADVRDGSGTEGNQCASIRKTEQATGKLVSTAAIDADPFGGGMTLLAGVTYTLTVDAWRDDKSIQTRLSLLACETEDGEYTELDGVDLDVRDTYKQLQLVIDMAAMPEAIGKFAKVQLMGKYTGYGNKEARFDNVQMSVIPEPATLSLLTVGSGLAILRGRRAA